MTKEYAEQLAAAYAAGLLPLGRNHLREQLGLPNIDELLRYAADAAEQVPHDTSDIIGLASALTDEDRHPDIRPTAISIRRAMLSDALRDAGDDETADMVKDARNHIVWHGGRVQKGKFQFSPITHHEGSDYDEAEMHLDMDGPTGAGDYLQQWHHDSARLYFDEPSWGSADRSYDIKLPALHDPHKDDDYVVYHNPRLGYIGLEHVREVPHDTPSGSR